MPETARGSKARCPTCQTSFFLEPMVPRVVFADEEELIGLAPESEPTGTERPASEGDATTGALYGAPDVMPMDVETNAQWMAGGLEEADEAALATRGTLYEAPAPDSKVRVAAQPVTLGSILLYPTREEGPRGMLFLTFVPLLGLFGAIFLGPLALLVLVFVFAMFPMVQFAAIQQTAVGADSLEGLPDPMDFAERGKELLATLVLASLPQFLIAMLSTILIGLAEASSWILLWIVVSVVIFLAYLMGFILWAIAVGATAVYRDWRVSIRLDLHLRVLQRCRSSVGVFLLRCLALLATGAFLSVVPLLNLAAPAWMLICLGHLIGLFFRDEQEALGSIYAEA